MSLVGRTVCIKLWWTRRSRHNFVHYPEIRQIAFEKSYAVEKTMGGSSIDNVSLFPTYEYTDRYMYETSLFSG